MPSDFDVYTNVGYLHGELGFQEALSGRRPQPMVPLEEGRAFGRNTGIDDLVEQVPKVCARLRDTEMSHLITCSECWHTISRDIGAITKHCRKEHSMEIEDDAFYYECIDNECFFLIREALDEHMEDHQMEL